MTTKVRTHLLLSKKVLDEIDELVGQRKRSEYIDEVLEEWLRRERMGRAMRAVRESCPVPGTPAEWDTPAGAAKWVHDLRREESQRQRRIEAMPRASE